MMNIKIIDKLKGILSITLSQVVSLYTHCKQQVLKAYPVVVTWVKRGTTRLKNNISINEGMARHGGLLMSFSLLLLAVRQTKEVSSWGFIPPVPVYFPIVLRIILIVISFILMPVVAKILQKRRRYKVAFRIILALLLFFVLWLISSVSPPVFFFTVLGIIGLLISLAFMVAVFYEGLAKILTVFVEERFKFIYWMVFLVVYSVGWIKGLSSVPADTCAFNLAEWIGFVLFCIIGFIYSRAAVQAGKQPHAI